MEGVLKERRTNKSTSFAGPDDIPGQPQLERTYLVTLLTQSPLKSSMLPVLLVPLASLGLRDDCSRFQQNHENFYEN